MKEPEIILDPKELDILKLVLEDIKKSLTCEFAIGGSMAQRALLPEFGQSSEANKKSDIDIVLLAGSRERCPVLPSIKNYFYVLSITESFDSYYFGLVHKKTKKWVDLFPVAYSRSCYNVRVEGKAYKAETISSQVLYLAHDLLRRIKGHKDVRQKWFNKIKFLFSQIKDVTDFENEFSSHKQYLLEDLPRGVKIPENAHEFIQTVIECVAPFVKLSTKRNWFLLFKNYYKDSVVTSNGIKVDSRFALLRTLF